MGTMVSNLTALPTDRGLSHRPRSPMPAQRGKRTFQGWWNAAPVLPFVRCGNIDLNHRLACSVGDAVVWALADGCPRRRNSRSSLGGACRADRACRVREWRARRVRESEWETGPVRAVSEMGPVRAVPVSFWFRY